MRATGIIRRIDDLGRVVIPKEIRRTMGIREGDPLEIYTDKDGCVIFKKYLPDNLHEQARTVENALRRVGIHAKTYDRDGFSTTENGDSVEIFEHDPNTFAVRTTDGDTVMYVITKSAPTDEQRMLIAGVLALAELQL